MKDDARVKDPFDICFANCISRIYHFNLCIFEHSCLHQGFVFGNVSRKGRELVVEAEVISFIAGIGRTRERDDCSAEVAIKYITHPSCLGSLDTV